VNLAGAQLHTLFCLRELLEVIVTNLLQRGDNAAGWTRLVASPHLAGTR
jgi:hypothetical protein